MKIAIIGSGISGLGAAYMLAPHHDLTIYEKNNRLGGHSRTIEVQTGKSKTPVDTGFIVFNNWNYPNLLGLFKQLDVPYEKSDMSFGVSIDDGWLEYQSGSMFAQTKNIVRPQFWGMIKDILKFNKRALDLVEKEPDITLETCLEKLNMGTWFRRYYLLAMGAAIWSCPIETIMKFPARTFLQFFKNHGLLSVNSRPQWYTVTGGSREYIKRLKRSFEDKIKLGQAAQSVTHKDGQIHIRDESGQTDIYDRIIFACHADEALAMIEKPHEKISQVIGAFDYQSNDIVVHSDVSFMPQNKNCWASWVYLSEGQQDTQPAVSLSYWMNNLQNLNPDYPIIVTLNPDRKPAAHSIMDETSFTHPIFDSKAIAAQSQIPDIQGLDNMWFCGAYQRYGFHEDGLLSAVNVVKHMGHDIPWH